MFNTRVKFMKFDWSNWNSGGKTIFVSACIGLGSMFMKWADIGLVSRSGLEQGAVLYLGFYVYPLLMLLQSKPIVRLWGLGCSIGAVALTVIYIDSQSIEFFGVTTNVAGMGAYLFILTSVALAVGILKYNPIDSRDN